MSLKKYDNHIVDEQGELKEYIKLKVYYEEKVKYCEAMIERLENDLQ